MTDTNAIPQTICEFLNSTGAQVQFYDMGRRVVEISNDDMLAIERQQAPYPQPFLRSAMIGVLFYYKDDDSTSETSNHQIWFLKFPLDEKGLLSQDARNDFLRRILETLAEQTLAKLNADSADDDATNTAAPAMQEDNPHGFTPRDDRMASFHAKIAKKLGQAPSQFYSHAVDYFSGNPGFEQWNFVGLQGIADVAARLDENDNQTILAKAIPQLPITPFAALCSCLENESIEADLSTVLGIRLEHDLHESDATLAKKDAANNVAAAIRGLSHDSGQQTLIKALQSTLATDIGHNVEVLATIAGRAWQSLNDVQTRRAFLQSLARCDAGQGAFDNIMFDLMFMPGLRKPLLDELRNLRDSNDCSSQQAGIIDSFFQSLKT